MILHGSATCIVFTTCYNSSFSSARSIFRYINKMKHMKINSDYTEIYKKLNEQSLQDASGDVIRERTGLGQGM